MNMTIILFLTLWGCIGESRDHADDRNDRFEISGITDTERDVARGVTRPYSPTFEPLIKRWDSIYQKDYLGHSGVSDKLIPLPSNSFSLGSRGEEVTVIYDKPIKLRANIENVPAIIGVGGFSASNGLFHDISFRDSRSAIRNAAIRGDIQIVTIRDTEARVSHDVRTTRNRQPVIEKTFFDDPQAPRLVIRF